MKKNHSKPLAFFLNVLPIAYCLLLASCGIEDYMYLERVPQGGITVVLNSEAAVRLPNIDTSQFYYFKNFIIFYRIYVSGSDFSGTIPETQLSALNPALASDYSTFYPYTDATNTSVNSSSIGSLFRNRNYRIIELSYENGTHTVNTALENVLSNSSLGKTAVLDFRQTPGFIPTLEVNGTAYMILRSNDNGAFSPLPDRYFRNTPDLTNPANIIAGQSNLDIVPASSSNRYAFAAFYIVAAGIDNNFSPIYSAPSFVGILRLPDSN